MIFRRSVDGRKVTKIRAGNQGKVHSRSLASPRKTMTAITVTQSRFEPMISAKQYNDRINYITRLMAIGLSRASIQARIRQEYSCSTTQSQVWWVRANQSLCQYNSDSAGHSRAQILEIVHAQISAYNADLHAINIQLQEIEIAGKRRKEIAIEKQTSDKAGKIRLNIELSAIPKFKVMTVCDCIERKAKIRSRIIHAAMSLAKIQGLLDRPLQIITAIERLAASELISAETASHLLELLGSLEQRLDRLG